MLASVKTPNAIHSTMYWTGEDINHDLNGTASQLSSFIRRYRNKVAFSQRGAYQTLPTSCGRNADSATAYTGLGQGHVGFTLSKRIRRRGLKTIPDSEVLRNLTWIANRPTSRCVNIAEGSTNLFSDTVSQNSPPRNEHAVVSIGYQHMLKTQTQMSTSLNSKSLTTLEAQSNDQSETAKLYKSTGCCNPSSWLNSVQERHKRSQHETRSRFERMSFEETHVNGRARKCFGLCSDETALSCNAVLHSSRKCTQDRSPRFHQPCKDGMRQGIEAFKGLERALNDSVDDQYARLAEFEHRRNRNSKNFLLVQQCNDEAKICRAWFATPHRAALLRRVRREAMTRQPAALLSLGRPSRSDRAEPSARPPLVHLSSHQASPLHMALLPSGRVRTEDIRCRSVDSKSVESLTSEGEAHIRKRIVGKLKAVKLYRTCMQRLGSRAAFGAKSCLSYEHSQL